MKKLLPPAPVIALVLCVAGGCGRTKTADINIDMVFVEGGTYTSGYDNRDTVTVGDFYIGKFEATQGLWKAVMGNKPSGKRGVGYYGAPSDYGLGDDYPVYDVDWYDVRKFIRKLNAMTGKAYRLPTRDEWEYAMRGGNRSKGYEYSGSDSADDVAWYAKSRVHINYIDLSDFDMRTYEGNSGGKAHPVGGKQPNELGIYDMSGNVYEWMDSIWETPGKFSGTNRYASYGGGSWRDWADGCHASYYSIRSDSPNTKDCTVGFRLAHDAEDSIAVSLEKKLKVKTMETVMKKFVLAVTAALALAGCGSNGDRKPDADISQKELERFAADVDAVLSGVGKGAGTATDASADTAADTPASGESREVAASVGKTKNVADANGGGTDDFLNELRGNRYKTMYCHSRYSWYSKDSSITGGRNAKSVQSVVVKNVEPLRLVYKKRESEHPGLAGFVIVKFAIDEFGKVLSAEVSESTVEDTVIENAVITLVKSLDFERIDKAGDVTKVTYPFKFSK